MASNADLTSDNHILQALRIVLRCPHAGQHSPAHLASLSCFVVLAVFYKYYCFNIFKYEKMSTEKLPRFSGMSFWFVPKKLVRTQKQILAKKITERGGIVLDDYVSETTHVLVPRGVSLEDAQKAMKTKDHKPRHSKIVRIDWLPKCIQECSIVPLSSFEVLFIFCN